MEASEWDHATLREEEFEQHAVYLVPDVATSPGDTNRAEASLPRNLVLKPSQALNDVCSFIKKKILSRNLLDSYKFNCEHFIAQVNLLIFFDTNWACTKLCKKNDDV